MRTRFAAGRSGSGGGVVPFARGIHHQMGIEMARAGIPFDVSLGDARRPLASPVIQARVSPAPLEGGKGWQGRWIADCPGCSGAEYVDLETLLFMCCSCWNVGVEHNWLTVRVPGDIQTIEAELVKRPGRNRHWNPGETMVELRHENREHGVS